MYRVFFKSLCVFTAVLGLTATAPRTTVANDATPVKPNIIFILADDMGYGDVSALYPEGKIKTPKIDRLAEEGMYFSDMHSSSSVCTPTRYSIMTGRYNWRSSLKSGVLQGYSRSLIEPGRMTVASMLKEAGYQTAVIGKWHLGLDWAVQDGVAESRKRDFQEKDIDFSKPFANGPLSHGFDSFFGISASLDMPPFVYLENDRATEMPTTRKKWVREGAAAESFEAIDVLPTITEKAVAYIEAHAEASKEGNPFFLYFPLNAPHTPILPTKQWQGASGISAYADFVMQVDDTVGQVIRAVDQAGIKENTIIIFTTDNGCSPAANIGELIEHGHYPNGVFRGHKADIFDGGHHVPFLVRWPSTIAAGSRSDELACLVDMMRTFAEIAEKTLPNEAAEDSVSLLPAFRGEAQTPLRTEVVHHSINGSFAIRQGDWKLCLCPDSGGWSDPKPGSETAKELPEHQLYHLQSDIREAQNLQEKHSQQVEQMKARLTQIIQEGRSTPKTDTP